jgi:hypothetical protein
MFYRAVIVKERTNSRSITLRAKSKEGVEEMMPRIKSFLYPEEDSSEYRYLIWTHEVEVYSPGVTVPEYQVTVYKPEEKKPAPRNPRVRRIWKDGKLIGEEIIPEEEEKPSKPERQPRPVGKRPQGDGQPRPQGGDGVRGGSKPEPIMPPSGVKQQPAKKKGYTEKTYTEKKPLSKRTLIKQ